MFSKSQKTFRTKGATTDHASDAGTVEDAEIRTTSTSAAMRNPVLGSLQDFFEAIPENIQAAVEKRIFELDKWDADAGPGSANKKKRP